MNTPWPLVWTKQRDLEEDSHRGRCELVLGPGDTGVSKGELPLRVGAQEDDAGPRRWVAGAPLRGRAGVALGCSWRAEQEQDVGAAITAFSRNPAGRGRVSSLPAQWNPVWQLLTPQTSQCLLALRPVQVSGDGRWARCPAPAAHPVGEPGKKAHEAAAAWGLARPAVKELGRGTAPRQPSASSQ